VFENPDTLNLPTGNKNPRSIKLSHRSVQRPEYHENRTNNQLNSSIIDKRIATEIISILPSLYCDPTTEKDLKRILAKVSLQPRLGLP
jgi:hypothetical protein